MVRFILPNRMGLKRLSLCVLLNQSLTRILKNEKESEV